MTIWRQVLQVARKDLRMAAGPLLVYGVMLVVATVSAVTGRKLGIGSSGWTILLIAVAMAVVAILVQGDSPARRDAFWVTRPLRPAAVFGAKVVAVFGAVLLPGLIAQGLALHTHGLAAADYPPLLLATAVATGLWLAAAAVIASLTRDLRAFVIVLAGTFVAAIVLASIIFASVVVADGSDVAIGVTFGAVPAAVMGMYVLALLALVGYQYRTRRVGRGVLLAVGLTVASGAVAAGRPFPAWVETRSPPPPQLRAPASASFHPADSVSGSRHTIAVTLTGASAAHRYSLESARVELHRADGTVHTVGGAIGGIWLNPFRDMSPSGSTRARLSVQLQPGAIEELRRGTARLALSGEVVVAGSRPLGELAVARPNGLAVRGRRIRVNGWGSGPHGPELLIAVSIVRLDAALDPIRMHEATRDLEYTFIHPAAGSPPLVRARGASSGGAHGLVLPGPAAVGAHEQLRLATATGEPLPAAARERARLRVAAWEPVGSYTIEVPVATGPDAGRR